QRVSIARAIAKNPKILLCDEPTGALDYETGKNVLRILQNMCKQQKKTVIVVTHNVALKDMADRVIHIKNGLISKIETNPNPKDIEEIEW
ncbi:MAG: ABC transporter ATP-binding protein, partial [Clostridia bacterium]|nr:ABC transporter ATP-binding protein [Clostridia bacterium]